MTMAVDDPRAPIRSLAFEYVEALRGRITDRDLSVVISSANCGEEYHSVMAAVAAANLYEFDLPKGLNKRAIKLLEGRAADLAEFQEILADSPAARGVHA